MLVVTSEEMKKVDQSAIKEYGIPGIVLMENAGLQVVKVVEKVLGDLPGKEIAIFVGKGNNGGDGLVVARHLLNRRASVKVLTLADYEEIKGDARVNLEIWRKMGQKVHSLTRGDSLNVIRLILMSVDLVVDAIYGTGFRGPVGEKIGGIIEVLNKSGKPVVAVDIPSGLEADTGAVNGPCIRASHTVTFGLPKLGLVTGAGPEYAGELHVVDISIPAMVIEKSGLKRYLLTAGMVREWLPQRRSTAHKGDFGRVLVVAGSRGMTGAACLAAAAAARAGAGLVTLGVPESLHDLVEMKLTEVMTVPLPDTGRGIFSPAARPEILALLERADVLALGPGLSAEPEAFTLVRELLPEVSVPCVLDADALNALAGASDLLKKATAPLVITPHPGEMAGLLGNNTQKIQENRLRIAGEAAVNWGATVLLKGYRTVVAAPDDTVYINPTGNPGMATGGSGDVLTGIIAAFLGQGLDTARAAAAGAYLHGLAGDLAAGEKGMIGLIAGDILEAFPRAIGTVLCHTPGCCR
ncbi:MAG: NAD(P)H-hydrate dehydratase [Peptococcaceae bacterium]|nr:MAG: NAD(P)H-hydrate dehydratase [Peptococcaceae bacterium]